jgi:hypothetical protein
MRVCECYDHLQATDLLLAKGNLFGEIDSIISSCELRFGVNRPNEIKTFLAHGFNRNGWADRVRIQNNNNLTISFLKNNVGICVQFGNVARTYADILKLTYLGKKRIIDLGVIIVPDILESKSLGANYAQFDRLRREIDIFSEIIDVPLLVLSLTN